ncbi:MAG: AMP-binding protein, partial [Planctomycetota bacterium]
LGILHDKSPAAYAGMLAAHRLGAPYVNLDHSSPPARLDRILDRCRPRLCWAAGAHRPLLGTLHLPDGASVLTYDDAETVAAVAAAPADPPPGREAIHGNTPAYIMFTSGSTGFPKGATMTHANVLGFAEWVRSTVAPTPDDVFTGLNPLHFDNSVFDVYGALFTGASLAPIGEVLLRQARDLVRAVEDAACTIWFSVPSLLVYVLRMKALAGASLPTMRAIVFGGEGFPKTQLRRLHALVGERIRLLNVYGPTECTCICSSYDLTPDDLAPDDLLPLGRLAPNFGGVVLDEGDRAAAPGAIGELCLLGPQVGLGYWRDAERTAAAFVQNPLNPRHREVVYRTGDLVREEAATGRLHFCGRKDNQIKHMGYRIELEEIESALGGLPEVNENAVVHVPGGDGPGRIVACVCTDATPDVLTERLRERLPPYMIPQEIVAMDELPKNRNGKIDRGALRDTLTSAG